MRVAACCTEKSPSARTGVVGIEWCGRLIFFLHGEHCVAMNATLSCRYETLVAGRKRVFVGFTGFVADFCVLYLYIYTEND